MAFTSTKKHRYESFAVTSTSTSGSTGVTDSGASFDDVICGINLTTITAGSVIFAIQTSMDDGTTWVTHPDATALGTSLTATGGQSLIARSPIGSKMRLLYTITTGPVAFTAYWNFVKRGDCK